MAKNVVYILGAGFSAPLGIPIMRNFIDKARSLKRDNDKYSYFNKFIDLAQNTVSAAVYFQHDSRNIEEALSLLEMKDNLENTNTKDELINFIADVVQASTPKTPTIETKNRAYNFYDFLFTTDQVWQGYYAFVSSLAHLDFRRWTDFQLPGIKIFKLNSTTEYSILSLNYDLVLENICESMANSFWWESKSRFRLVRNGIQNNDVEWPSLVKIHGSADTRDIIPPTFNKGLYGSKLPQSWRDAYESLSRANEIRVIGYSLPQTDSYIKYLLMASIDKFKDLDRIDWIVRDTSGEVENRIQKFIRFENIRVIKADAADYLKSVYSFAVNWRQTMQEENHIGFNTLEETHEQFFRSR